MQISKPDSPHGTDLRRDVLPLMPCLVTSSEYVWQYGWDEETPGHAFVSGGFMRGTPSCTEQLHISPQ